MTPTRGFSNEDLKRFKKDMEDAGEFGLIGLALLHRLEAAENCAKGLSNLVVLQKLKGFPKDLVEAWRKAKGDLK